MTGVLAVRGVRIVLVRRPARAVPRGRGGLVRVGVSRVARALVSAHMVPLVFHSGFPPSVRFEIAQRRNTTLPRMSTSAICWVLAMSSIGDASSTTRSA